MIGQRKNTAADIVVVGFALFSMFFGAGNVIFPPFLGMEAGSQWLAGFSTYFIADIGLAMMGMFALLRVGSSEKVLERAGEIPAEILMCAIILCIGPMVAIPRTSASTYEMAIAPNLSGVSPVVFSVVFFAVILALCIKESAVVDIVGKVLTPLLLVGLFAIIIKGVITPLGDIAPLAQIDNVAVTGIKAGYQTMDALAALPFGIIVLQSVTAKGYQRGQSQLRVVGGAALLAGVLLLAVYMGLAYLGATVSAQYTSSIGRAALIMAIVEALMGKTGMVIFGVVVGLACVTTAIALTSSAAAYFTELCRGKISYKVFVTVICVFSAVVSNLGLDRIVAVAAPVLDIVYPPTLVLICVSLIIPKVHDFVSRGAALGALLTSVLCTLHTYGVKLPLVEALPLYDLGLSWLLPAAVFGLAAQLLTLLPGVRCAEKPARRASEKHSTASPGRGRSYPTVPPFSPIFIIYRRLSETVRRRDRLDKSRRLPYNKHAADVESTLETEDAP